MMRTARTVPRPNGRSSNRFGATRFRPRRRLGAEDPPTSDAEGFGFVGDRDLRPVEADPLGLVVDEREDRRRPPPHAFEVAQRVPRVVELEVLARGAMPEQELAAVQVVRIDHVDERLPEVGQLPQQRVLDLLELARLDLEPPRPAILLEREKLLIATEVEREELVDERD